MKDFWSFYQNMDTMKHPFRVFHFSHLVYVALTVAAIVLLLRAYKNQDEPGRRKWEKVLAAFIFFQEIFYYAWIYVGCQTNVLFEVLHLELCTFCVFLDASILLTRNKQVRFFGAVMGIFGAPIAIAYPVTVADIYPAFSYRIIGFYLAHGALVLFSLMMLCDRELLTKRRLMKNIGITGAMLAAVYCFNLKFGTQYMFVGTPPEIGIIRMVYDLVGSTAFLPTAIVIFSGYEGLIYLLSKKLQRRIYPKEPA